MSRTKQTVKANNGERTPVFFERALGHCYHQIEVQLKLIAKTPNRFAGKLYRDKNRLQREANYIESKLKDSGIK